ERLPAVAIHEQPVHGVEEVVAGGAGDRPVCRKLFPLEQDLLRDYVQRPGGRTLVSAMLQGQAAGHGACQALRPAPAAKTGAGEDVVLVELAEVARRVAQAVGVVDAQPTRLALRQ